MQTAATLDTLIAKPRTTSLENEMGTALSDCRIQLFGPVIQPPPPPPPPGAEKPPTFDINTFNRRAFAMTWPLGVNADLDATGPIGGQDVLVLSFTTPAVGDGRTKLMQAVEKGASSFGCFRLMTLASQPQVGGGIVAFYSQTPIIKMKVGGTPSGPNDTTAILKPATQYFVTIVNRRPPPGNEVSIAPPNTGQMKIHFNN